MTTTFINLNKHHDKHVKLTKKGHYLAYMKNISGKFIFEIDAPDVNLDILGIYTGKADEAYHVDTLQLHKSPGGLSNLFIKGVFDGHSRLEYEGLIRIEKAAQKSHAYQKNQNLIVSKNAYVESKPYLEILANDVFCTHGSTTGRLNTEDIFYAVTRGIHEKKARELLIDGFIHEIYDMVLEKVPGITLAELQ